MATTNLQTSAPIPGIMQTLRDIRDRKSLEHMNMTAREVLEYYERRREKSFWNKKAPVSTPELSMFP
jgi:hypothetical protein